MKYDCTKTCDYIHELTRMCRSYEDGFECRKCPLMGYTHCKEEAHIAEVQKWSDEHQEKARLDRLKEAFPAFIHHDIWDGIPYGVCVKHLGFPVNDCDRTCRECWNKPDDYPN